MKMTGAQRLNEILFLQMTTNEVDKLVVDIFAGIQDAVFTELENKLIRRYVQHIQFCCTEIMDLLEQDNTEVNYTTQECLHIQKSLSHVLKHLRKYYRKFYELDALLPKSLMIHDLKLLENKGNMTFAKLKERFEDRRLMEIVEEAQTNLIKSERCSCLGIEMQEGILDKILTLCRSNPTGYVDEKFFNLLLSNDFRPLYFLPIVSIQLATW